MHVPLGRHQVAVTSKFLDRFGRSSAHREARTNRVSQHVHAALAQSSPASGSPDKSLHVPHRERSPVIVAEHARRFEMTVIAECCHEPLFGAVT
jgi:hypothetical protein